VLFIIVRRLPTAYETACSCKFVMQYCRIFGGRQQSTTPLALRKIVVVCNNFIVSSERFFLYREFYYWGLLPQNIFSGQVVPYSPTTEKQSGPRARQMVDRSPASSCWASCPPLLLSSSSPPPSSPRALSRAPARVPVAAAAGNRFRRAQLSKRRRAHRCRLERYHNNCDDDDWSRRRAGYYYFFFFKLADLTPTVAGRPARLDYDVGHARHIILF